MSCSCCVGYEWSKPIIQGSEDDSAQCLPEPLRQQWQGKEVRLCVFFRSVCVGFLCRLSRLSVCRMNDRKYWAWKHSIDRRISRFRTKPIAVSDLELWSDRYRWRKTLDLYRCMSLQINCLFMNSFEFKESHSVPCPTHHTRLVAFLRPHCPQFGGTSWSPQKQWAVCTAV